jgi:uncharacterized membrane protein YcaP (DUF421 family)
VRPHVNGALHELDGDVLPRLAGPCANTRRGCSCLRISGKRTLAKLNAFDLVVTVALGSTLSAILLQESIALAEGAAALGLLILMQFLVTFVSVRWQPFAQLVRSEPTLLARAGAFCSVAMKRERVTEDEVLSAVRSAGGREVADVDYLVLESDGTISVSLRSAATKLPK